MDKEKRSALDRQASHVLLALSCAPEGHRDGFERWLTGPLTSALSSFHTIVAARHYRQSESDITLGRHEPIPQSHLSAFELALDGGEEAAGLITSLTALFRDAGHGNELATWLYYLAAPPVGDLSNDAPWLTVALANAIPGMESAFREFYATRHVRHALAIPALASGQFLERAQFQRCGGAQPKFAAAALYRQTGDPQAIIDAFATLAPGTLEFPMLDKARGRFAEASYRRLS